MYIYSFLTLGSVIVNIICLGWIMKRFFDIPKHAKESFSEGAKATGRFTLDLALTLGTATVLSHVITPVVATMVGPVLGLYTSAKLRGA